MRTIIPRITALLTLGNQKKRNAGLHIARNEPTTQIKKIKQETQQIYSRKDRETTQINLNLSPGTSRSLIGSLHYRNMVHQ